MTEPEHTWELALPFVAVASKGGPYDDASFAAGVTTGRLDVLLATLAEHKDVLPPNVLLQNVPSALTGQVDLVAMRHGFVCTVLPVDEDWALVRFELTTAEPT